MFRYLKPSNFSLFQNHHLFEIDLSWRHIKLPNLQNLPIHKGWLELSKKQACFAWTMQWTRAPQVLNCQQLEVEIEWLKVVWGSKVFDYNPDWAGGRKWSGMWRALNRSGLASPSNSSALPIHSFLYIVVYCTVSCVRYWFNYCLNISREDAVRSGDFRKPEWFDPWIHSTFNQFPWEPFEVISLWLELCWLYILKLVVQSWFHCVF